METAFILHFSVGGEGTSHKSSYEFHMNTQSEGLNCSALTTALSQKKSTLGLLNPAVWAVRATTTFYYLRSILPAGTIYKHIY